jgi:hypothetical protein
MLFELWSRSEELGSKDPKGQRCEAVHVFFPDSPAITGNIDLVEYLKLQVCSFTLRPGDVQVNVGVNKNSQHFVKILVDAALYAVLRPRFSNLVLAAVKRFTEFKHEEQRLINIINSDQHDPSG